MTQDNNWQEPDPDYDDLFGPEHNDDSIADRVNGIYGDHWWAFIKDSFNFTLPDSNGVGRRFRFRIKSPTVIEYGHPDDVIIMTPKDAIPHGSFDLRDYISSPDYGCKISIIQRDGSNLTLVTMSEGTFTVSPSDSGDMPFQIRRNEK